MLDCKKFPTPSSIAYVSSVVSGLYTVTSTVGSLLLILVILVDPYKQLKKRLNLWLIHTAILGIIIGGIVDPYRSYGNYLKAVGESIDKVIPNRIILSKTCHVHLFCCMIVVLLHLFAILIDQYVSSQSTVKTTSRKSLMLFGVGSAIIWGIGYAFGIPTVFFGFDNIEEIVYTVTAVGSLIGLVVSMVYVYHTVMKHSRGNSSEITMAEKGDGSPNNFVKPIAPDENGSEVNSEASVEESIENDDPLVIIQNAKAVMISFAFLVTCSVPACIMSHMGMSDMLTSCVQSYWLKHVRILFVASFVAWGPFVYLLTFPGMKRGLIGLFKMRKRSQIEPLEEK